MGASEYAGLSAGVTGGASGIGLATARLSIACGARAACLGLKPDDVPAPLCVGSGTAGTPWTGRLLDRAAAPEADAQHRAPASRWADLSPPTTSPAPSRTSRARSPVPPQLLVSPSTAACTDCGSGTASDLPHETVRKEKQP